jgi:hypothetical protein
MNHDLPAGLDLAAYFRDEASKRSKTMTPVSYERLQWWTSTYGMRGDATPIQVWESCRYFALLFVEPPYDGIDVRRLSICRCTLKADGSGWEENLSWDELAQVKRECGFADLYGLELYPRDVDILNCVNVRHLWLLARPLQLGRFRGAAVPLMIAGGLAAKATA